MKLSLMETKYKKKDINNKKNKLILHSLIVHLCRRHSAILRWGYRRQPSEYATNYYTTHHHHHHHHHQEPLPQCSLKTQKNMKGPLYSQCLVCPLFVVLSWSRPADTKGFRWLYTNENIIMNIIIKSGPKSYTVDLDRRALLYPFLNYNIHCS